MITDWETPPEPHETGDCLDCGGSIAPRSVRLDVVTPTYEGPLVLLFYRDLQGTRKMAINGTVFTWNQVAAAILHANDLMGVPYADQAMCEALIQLERPGTCGTVH